MLLANAKTKAQISSAADQRLCFRYIDSTIPLLKSEICKPIAIFRGSTAKFVSDLARNPVDRFT